MVVVTGLVVDLWEEEWSYDAAVYVRIGGDGKEWKKP